jgi:hypothetical protein
MSAAAAMRLTHGEPESPDSSHGGDPRGPDETTIVTPLHRLRGASLPRGRLAARMPTNVVL